MARGGGKYRSQIDTLHGFEEKGRQSGWGVAPPSRHLWVGNLNPRITKNALSEHFLRFGELENIVYSQGRSFAFVNYRKEDDAVIALRGLQGVVIEGTPLRIEFSKGDRLPLSSREEEYPRYNNERHPTKRGESFSRRDARPFHPSPEKTYDSKGSKNAEPCEMLWIGFPASLTVDEPSLRRAFSPFGEIEKITTFPGRSYAFVQYRSVVAACRAKEALQGKLLNNPRVRICFSKSDVAQAEHGRSSMSALPLNLGSDFHSGPSRRAIEAFEGDDFDSPTPGFHRSSPGFVSDFKQVYGDAGDADFGRGSFLQAGVGLEPNVGAFLEHVRFPELGSRRMLDDAYNGYGSSPAAERDRPWRDHPYDRQRISPFFENSWGGRDDIFPLAKKLKAGSLPDTELPEYPFTNIEPEINDGFLPKLIPSLHKPRSVINDTDTLNFGYKGVPDYSRNISHPRAGSDDSWRNSDAFNAGPALPSSLSSILQKASSEFCQPPLNKEWKWEGTIAKGGTPVCRARCFPVGKVLDFLLPDFLDCTARTGLDMLARHYYQAASAWVVFFVPETDVDIAFYNELMHYLGERQRAAVAKLGEKTTLFLVPPSEFSEQILKVPGKVSISGVILKFQQANSSISSFQYPMDAMESKLSALMPMMSDGISHDEDSLLHKPSPPIFPSLSHSENYYTSSLAPLAAGPLVPSSHKPGDNIGSVHSMDNLPDLTWESRHDWSQCGTSGLQSSWSSSMHIPNSSIFRPPPPNAASHSSNSTMMEKYPPSNPRVSQETSSGKYTAESSGVAPLALCQYPPLQETKPQPPSSLPLPLYPEQLAQLTSLLGQQKQPQKEAVLSTEGSNSRSILLGNLNLISSASVSSGSVEPLVSHAPTLLMPQTSHASSSSGLVLPQVTHAPVPSRSGGPLITRGQHLQPQTTKLSGIQEDSGQQNHQQAPNSTKEEAETDPQKRLQATLQLAAALLQQIQQQGKT